MGIETVIVMKNKMGLQSSKMVHNLEKPASFPTIDLFFLMIDITTSLHEMPDREVYYRTVYHF
jgi:hypothetical protein